MLDSLPWLLLAALLAGVAVVWAWLRSRDVARLRGELTVIEQRERDLAVERAGLAARLDEAVADETSLREQLVAANGQLEARRDALETARREHDRAQTELAGERRAHEEKLALVTSARAELTAQFQQLASEILEDKSRRFGEQNQQALGALLEPVRERLQSFQTKVEELYVSETRERGALGAQLQQLQDLNRQLSTEANALTEALKGSAKTRGAWGEMVLERLLEIAGLQRGRDYDTQVSFTREDASRAQPDVVVHLPKERKLVIDAKVSLIDYATYMAANDDAERQDALQRHRAAVKRHMQDLGGKDYAPLLNGHSQDFVLMFVPIEPALLLALGDDDSLYADAANRNVLLVGPSTLLLALRTVAHLWRQEAQSRNALDIANRGAALYDKFVGFVSDLDKIGERLRQAQASYDEARKKLSVGPGNAVRQAEMLRELGVKPKNVLPDALRDNAGALDVELSDKLAESEESDDD